MTKDHMIPLDEALHIVDETLAGVKPIGETVAVRQAIGRVLLTDQTSRLDLPPFDKAAMDGYAVLADDVRDEYRVLETIAAGQTGRSRLVSGCCVKIMTGAAVPIGTGRVIMVEHTEQHGEVVKILRHDEASNVCRQAEDVRRGQTVLSAGTTLGVPEVTHLIACGLADVEVARRVNVAIISTGDELIDNPERLTPGKIMNTNGPMLAALANEYGLIMVSEKVLPDDREATVEGIRRAVANADMVVLSGGVSAGDLDLVSDALVDAELTVRFSRVAVKPGAPMTYAFGRNKAVFGLPGNPVTAFLMFHVFVLRAVARLTGSRDLVREYTFPLARDWKRRKTHRTDYVPCRFTHDGTLEPVGFHGSAHLAALCRADGFFIVPVGRVKVHAGAPLSFVSIGRVGAL